ncbi:hypothetical protein ACQKFG_04780 [Peribacillus sp. NPDC076916]|uniref:hypothetical protein n=1 Tax=Peribacillus sp. NPDC076916 TaxID=3390608 RepID=UPI003CFCA37F
MIKIFEATDMNKAAILATVEGINIGLLTVDLVDGKHLVTYRNEYPEKLQPLVDQMIKQYDKKTLMIDANKLCFHLSFLRFLHNKKVKEFKSKH